MHWRGKSFFYEIVHPGGRRETLLSVPRWDFNWQSAYQFEKPIKLPKGARLHAVAHWDNSSNNLLNPGPEKRVHFGLQTVDEMMFGFAAYVWERPETAVELSKKAADAANRRRALRTPREEVAAAAAIQKLGGQIGFLSTQDKFITAVEFRDAGVTDALLKKLLKDLKQLKKLKHLSFVGCSQLTDAGLAELLKEHKDLKELETLFLGGTGITDAGLKGLQDLKELRRLGLAHTRVTDQGLKHLSSMEKLQVLFLANTRVTDAGLQNLKGLTDLQQLIVTGAKVTDKGVAELQKTAPKLQVRR